MGLEISDQVVDRLAERTEGWVAGLQLAGLSLRGHVDPDAFVEGFGASDRYVFDYLADEALARQRPDTRAFLEATSILDRLSGPICDALTGRTDGAATLAALEEANLFLAPLDERREWYRYHGLFAELLRSALPPARRVELHRAAADWFARHDLPLEGIRHHSAAGEHDRAAALMETVADATFARGEFRTILAWCDALPVGVLAGRPSLGVSRAWAQFFTGDIAGAEARVRELTTGDGREDATSSPRLACLEAWIANRHDQPDAEQLARRAIEGIPVGDPVFRGLALTTLGEALIGRDVRAAAAAFEEAHSLAETARRPTLIHGIIYSLATAGLVMGRRRDVEALCRRTIESPGDRRGTPRPSLGMVHLPLGVALFEADELVQARQHIATGLELCDRAGLGVTMLGGGEWHEILGLHLVREADRAWRRLEAVRRLGERHGIARIGVVMSLLAANLHLLEGDPAAADRELESVPGSLAGLLGSANDRAPHTRARVHLANGRSLEALDVLERAARAQREGERHGPLISTLVLASAAHDRVGSRARSNAALSEAVTLAADQDYRRAFMDGAAPVAHLLPGVRGVAPAFVDGLLARLASTSTSAPAEARPAPDERAAFRPADGSGPLEPLSVRELEVLRLVAAGLSNDEIGRELYVTTGTAKWHVHNVLAKVGSRNRAALIARARSLGLV
jgi:LuxR family maltose regulon positive regulatory protein